MSVGDVVAVDHILHWHALSGLKWGAGTTQGVALGSDWNAPLGLKGGHAYGLGRVWS
jgi:hypothetical protein